MSTIFTLPLGKLNGALVKHGYAPEANKSNAIRMVTIHLIESGKETIESIRNITGQTDTADFDLIKRDLLANLKASHEQLKDSIEVQLHKVAEEIKDLIPTDSDIRACVPSVDVSKDVAAEVARVFDAFKRSVPEPEFDAIVTSAPTFRLARAGDIFPACVYTSGGRTIDFSDMEIAVWSDTCPEIVEDYVFDPAHLHQTLVALDDPLPDNVWLAGERGTGKTEFVTQVAARLGRKLFRVNFDEAIERADFIGSNTIEDGNVVWKAGIIAQAIQHAGSIILLDEVGFARAQSIAILHSLCERSQHRALTVTETGERIPVAQYVAFFAADNSNGHGDSTGNFAGVRDQNTAFIDRFGFTLEFNYLSPTQESALIQSRTGVTRDLADQIVGFANVARAKAKSGLLTQPPSLRQLFAWARAVHKNLPIGTAFKNAVVNKYPAECAPELAGIFAATIKE